ncbi:MAG: tRNA pseudouridine(38-40) synthase TruA [Bacteroidales bacterium]|nr:tRNA pseudouridine(38-40) synthase TruA [Bacteroidales bacterium]
MKRIKITIAYDGSRYNGWQIQRSTDNTIQGKISAVLERMCGHVVEVNGSGRTDAGVHARQQVASFDIDSKHQPADIHAYLCQYLPEDIAVLDVEEAEAAFHARYSCRSKTYMYRIHTSRVPNVFERRYLYTYTDKALDISKMREAARLLCGTHDYKAFCGNPKMKKSTVRTITDIKIEVSGPEIDISYTGDGFLQNMVRILTGTLIEVGNGSLQASAMTRILDSKDRQMAGFTAPPQGLTLMRVEY